MQHPIRDLLVNGFDDFFSQVEKEVKLGNIDRTDCGDLTLLDYSRDCQFNEAWNPITEVCRGLIVDIKNKRVVALPLPKFWNLNERGTSFKNLPYTAQEKMDGSMGLIWFYNNKWNVSTRGSFSSPQAIKGHEMLRDKYPLAKILLDANTTLVTEIIYAENKIVVDYKGAEKLVLLTAYNNVTMQELSDQDVDLIAGLIDMERPKVYNFQSFLELEASVKTWDRNQEGVVVKFSDGTRCKIKSDDYVKAHKLISHFSPLSVWESVKDNVEMEFIKELPDEFQEQYKTWKKDFESQAQTIWDGVVLLYESTKHLSDKELGLKNQAKELGDYGGMIFAIRKNGADLNNKKARNWVYENFRPTGNVLKKIEE